MDLAGAAPTASVPQATVEAASIAAARTRWSYNPYTPGGSDTRRMEEISEAFVALFTRALEKRGCAIRSGVETEMAFVAEQEVDLPSFVEKLPAREALVTRIKNYVFDKEEQKKRDPDSPFSAVARVYNDDGNLEIVTWPLAPLTAMRRVKQLKQLLLESTSEFAYHAPDYALSQETEAFRDMAGLRAIRFEEERVSRTVSKFNDWLGEHINLSLNRISTTGGPPKNMMDGGYAELLKDTFNDHARGDFLLLLHSPMSYRRALERYPSGRPYQSYIRKTNPSGIEILHMHRLEWHAPDAASDIHQTMLVAMAHTYSMVTALLAVEGTNTLPEMITPETHKQVCAYLNQHLPPAPYEAAAHPAESIRDFAQASVTTAMMREVVKESVPPEEQPAYQAMIAEFERLAIRQFEQRSHAANPRKEKVNVRS